MGLLQVTLSLNPRQTLQESSDAQLKYLMLAVNDLKLLQSDYMIDTSKDIQILLPLFTFINKIYL